MTIVVIVSAYAIVFGNIGRRQTALSLEAQKIAELVLRAKSLAITTFSTQSSACGYGMEINYPEQTYSLFSYATSTSQPDCSGITVLIDRNRNRLPGESRKVGAGLRLVGTAPDGLYAVLFVPPEPLTLISSNSGGTVGTSPARVYLETVDEVPERAYKEISISIAGQVDF